MKTIYTFIAVLVSIGAVAQTQDSVVTNSNSQDVFYNLNNGDAVAVDKNSWDIGFTTAGFDAGIIVNENKGTALYLYSADTSKWSAVDTTGFDFAANRLYNHNESWSEGAFNNMGLTHPDYGWGVYTSSNHHVYGSRIFLLDNGVDVYQVMIDELTVAGEFKFRYKKIGGTEASGSVTKGDYSDKQLVYFDFASEQIVDDEPAKEEWQLAFTKYHAADAGNYLVSGVKIRGGLEVAERTGVDVSSNDTVGLNWNDNITEIGYNWKTFNINTYEYDITADLTYFVRNDIGDVWKVWFTGYTYGGATYHFYSYKLSSNASTNELTKAQMQVYPNPAAEYIQLSTALRGSGSLRILNLQGQLVLQEELPSVSSIKQYIGTIPSGTYFVQVIADGTVITERLIIE